MIVLTVTQLVFRVMRVTLTEWVGDTVPLVRNMHVSTIISMVLTLALVLTGTWVYLWQMFGASNQLMAALSLLVVTVWLRSEKRNPSYALYPMLFMYFTTLFATVVTARNLYVTIASNPEDERAAGRRRLGDDRRRRAPDRRRARHRVGRSEGVPEVQRNSSHPEARPRAPPRTGRRARRGHGTS